MAIYSHDFVVCPWCNEKSGHRVDHLYDSPGTRWGPWYCNECGGSFSGSVTGPRDVTVRKEREDKTFLRSMALLKLDGKDGPVYFVIDHRRYCEGAGETDEEMRSHQRYFFEEHSCPTNWLRDCAAVIQDGDCDPHGFLDFVRAVDVQEDFDADSDEQWPILFPEAFTGETIDGTVNAPTKILAGRG